MRAALWIVALGLLGGCRASTVAATRSPEAAAPAVSEERANPRHVPTFAEKERAYHEALALDARDRQAFEGLAQLYYDRGVAGDDGYTRLAMAVIDQGERVLAEAGQASAELAALRGLIELERGRPDRARTAFSAALRADPAHGVAALNLARIELRLREPAAALEHLAIAARTPALALEVHLSEGAAHFAAGDPQAAEASLVAAQGLAPDDPRPHYNQGLVAAGGFLTGVDEWESGKRAIAALQRYLELTGAEPTDPRAERARAMIDAIDEVLSRPLCQPPPPSPADRAAEAAERRRLLDLERQLEEE